MRVAQNRAPFQWALAVLFLFTFTLGLTACSSSPDPINQALVKAGVRASAIHTMAASDYDRALQQSHGFDVGPSGVVPSAVVFFDPQCPHCATIWANALPLRDQRTIRWVPIGVLNSLSGPQGALILASHQPVVTMSQHENSLRDGGGGLPLTGTLTPAWMGEVADNLTLVQALNIGEVPYMLHRSADGSVHGVGTEMTTEQLRIFLAS